MSLSGPSRTPGGHRRYSREDMKRLRVVRDEIVRGRPLRDAVAVATGRPDPRVVDLVARFVEATTAFDQPEITAVLDAGVARVGLESTLADLVFPAMRWIGALWEQGRCDVGREHAATEAVESWLRTRGGSSPSASPPSVVLACGPKDTHAVGLLSLATLLTGRGASVLVLGSSTPEESLLEAVKAVDSAAAVVISHMAVNRGAASASLRRIAGSTRVPCFYAGGAFLSPTVRKGVQGEYLGEDLIRAADRVEEVVGARIPESSGARR